MKKLLIPGLFAALACAAYAYPTLGGPTGLLTVPTTAIASTGQLQVALDWWNDSNADATVPLRAVYGLNDKLEVGAAFTTSEASGSDDLLSINAKYLTPFTLGDANLAVGAGLSKDGDSVLSLYGTMTKTFAETFNGTVALQWDDESDDFLLGIGAETQLDNGLRLIAEYINTLPGVELRLAARYPLTDALTAQFGVVGSLNSVTIGAAYAFGTGD